MRPESLPGLDALIHSIHAAAGFDDRWEQAISGLRAVLGGRAATLGQHDFGSGHGEWLFESPARPAEREAYPRHSVHNPWFLSSSEYRPGRVMTGDELIDSNVLQRTDFYRRLLEPLGLHHRLCGVVSRQADIVHYAVVLRGPEQPAFDAGDRSLFASILRHLTISFGNHQRLVTEHRENVALRSVMDRMESAILVVDENARVLLANTSFTELLESCDGLDLRGGRIAAASRAEDRALRETIAEVAYDAPCASAKTVTVSSPGEPYPVAITIFPARDETFEGVDERDRCAVLVAKDPHHRHIGSEGCAFANLFGLTAAQGRVAALILAGESLSDASQVLGISDNTVRSHLKQIYLKTETHSQIELVRLHARVCSEHI